MWLTRQLRFFDQWNFAVRHSISRIAQDFIDDTLFNWKLKTLEDSEMVFKNEVERYTLPEVASSRLVLKNNNGIIFLSDRFQEMYPDATFLALARDPVPLYESHKRHKTPVSRSLETFADFYNRMTDKMLADAERWPFYYILRFEDVVADPAGTARVFPPELDTRCRKRFTPPLAPPCWRGR